MDHNHDDVKEPQITTQLPILKYNGSELESGSVFEQVTDDVAIEYPLTIRLNGEEFATIVCTPSHLNEMIIGFLASEGVIRFMDEIKHLYVNEDLGIADVELTFHPSIHQQSYSKRFIGSCCGKSRQFYFYNDAKTAKTILHRMKITADQCISLMTQLQQSSEEFQRTGGVHNAALCTVEQRLFTRTDIGRHNALDKIYGHCLQNRIPLKDKVIAFSGRISSEVILKVSKIGVGILLSKSAPTDLALQLADDLGITAVGFIRNDRFNVYTHAERIQL